MHEDDEGPITKLYTTTPPTLEQAQQDVGGYVELITLRDGSQMLVNEEGRLLDLPYNVSASQASGQYIVGDAVILTGAARWS